MNWVIIQGLALGALGCFHCAAMCGPFVLAIPSQNFNTLCALFENLGRAITYSIMGYLIGLLGDRFIITSYQNIICISIGLMFLSLTLFPKLLITKIPFLKEFSVFIPKLLKPFLSRPGLKSSFCIGLIHGLLPCGLTYMALSASLAMNNASDSSLFMLGFGLGTMPILLIMSILRTRVLSHFSRYSPKILKAGLLLFSLIFILRGLALDIPYLSPIINNNSGSCCQISS